MSNNGHTDEDDPRDVDVLIIGAGASGIGAAIRLQQAGHRDVVVLEKADSLGGTWRDNVYPGCACDVPSALYSYSFAPNPDWTRGFARQPEIRAYLERTVAAFGVDHLIRFGVEVLDARWSAKEQQWIVRTNDGLWRAHVLVAAAGPWHEPLIPDLPGLDTFPGRTFHSSRWPDVDLTGRRVAVVGTGASAVQFVPEIAPRVAELHLFQRTAQWVLPKPDPSIPAALRRLQRRAPRLQRALGAVEYRLMETLGLGFRNPALLRAVQRIGVLHLRRSVPDPELRRALTPDYTLGCKRLLMSNTYYRSLTRDSVTLHATAVSEVRGSTVVGADGGEAEVDVLVFGTGFHITDMPIADRVRDDRGCSLAEVWQGSPEAYLGTSVSGFPNLFLLLGPNLGTGHSSAFSILEAQLDLLVDALESRRRHGWVSADVRADAQAEHVAAVQAALPKTVYNAGGCSSYYLDATGRNSFAWPWSTDRLRRRLRRFEESSYQLRT